MPVLALIDERNRRAYFLFLERFDFDLDAHTLHQIGQHRLRQRDAIFYKCGGHHGIGVRLEAQGRDVAAVVARLGFDAHQQFSPVDLLLDRRRDGVRDGLIAE